MIQNLIFGIQIIFDFRFSGRKSQSQQKLAKKITHYTIHFHAKHLIHFTNLISLNIENDILAKQNQKSFSLCKFSSKHVSVWYQKNICTALFLDTQELFESKCLYIYVYLLKKVFVLNT